jgi:hypothetical protein
MECYDNSSVSKWEFKHTSIKKYKQLLWDKIEDMLEIAGYDVTEIKQDLLHESKSIILKVIAENRFYL